MAFAVIILAVGLVMLFAGVRLRAAARRFMRRAERTRGEIVSLRSSWSSGAAGSSGIGQEALAAPTTTRRTRSWFPTVAFTTASGDRVTAEAPVGTNPPAGRVGDTVAMLYDPADPAQIRIDTVLGRGSLPGTIGVWLGAILVAIGIIVLLVAG